MPSEIVHRKKKGFGIPVARWIRHDLREMFQQTLVDEWPASLSMFDQNEIARLHQRHLRGEENLYKELWALFVLARWVAGHAPRVDTSNLVASG